MQTTIEVEPMFYSFLVAFLLAPIALRYRKYHWTILVAGLLLYVYQMLGMLSYLIASTVEPGYFILVVLGAVSVVASLGCWQYPKEPPVKEEPEKP